MMDTLSQDISRAVLSHFTLSLKPTVRVFYETDPYRPKDATHVEIRINGPDSSEDTNGEFHVEFSVSLLISVVKPDNIYSVDVLIDLCRGFTHEIPIEDGVCAEIMLDRTLGDALEVSRLGQIDVALDMHQATVNAKYSFDIKE
jgi:hypothetical protein